MKRLLPIVLGLVLVGCASPAPPDTCTRAIASYQLYQASLADGRVPSADEKRIALAAAAFLQLQCGWSPAVKQPANAKAFGVAPSVDANGVPILIP